MFSNVKVVKGAAADAEQRWWTTKHSIYFRADYSDFIFVERTTNLVLFVLNEPHRYLLDNYAASMLLQLSYLFKKHNSACRICILV